MLFRSQAFFNCTTLTSITIPRNTTYIGAYAFSSCPNIDTINYNAINSFIDNGIFSYGNTISTLNIGQDVEYIDYSIYNNILTSINVHSNNNYYASSNGVLYNKTMDILMRCPMGRTGTFTIPNSVTKLKMSAFSNCSSLTSITIPNSVLSIEDYVFSGCRSLTNMIIPNSVTSIGEGAFST